MTMNRGGTHFDDDARDAMTGALGTEPAAPAQHDHSRDDTPDPAQGGALRGYSHIHCGWVVDCRDTVQVFTTETAARAWCAGTWKPAPANPDPRT